MRFAVVYVFAVDDPRAKWFDAEDAARRFAEKVSKEGATGVALTKEIDRPLQRIVWASDT